MKYFKRSIIGSDSISKKKWDQALDAYRDYTSSILDDLSESTQEFLVLTSYHDAALCDFEHDTNKRTLILRFHDHAPLRFAKVEDVKYTGNERITQEQPNVWLYDEIEVLPNHLIKFCILLEDGELKIRAGSVEVLPKNS